MSGADELLAAVRAGDVAAIERLVAGGPGLAAAPDGGVSAVRIALIFMPKSCNVVAKINRER